jgi:hypothetical protein
MYLSLFYRTCLIVKAGITVAKASALEVHAFKSRLLVSV